LIEELNRTVSELERLVDQPAPALPGGGAP
jgi:hypothetical protein